MQDNFLACHTCFGGPWMLSVKPIFQTLNVSDDMK